MISRMQLVVRLATLAVAVGTWSLVGATAQADGRACNPSTSLESKWIAIRKGDSSCSGNTSRQQSWFLVAPGQCVTMFTHSAANRFYWYFTQGAVSNTTFPSLSSQSNRWKEIFGAGFGGFNSGTCFDQAQLSCSNPGVSCATVPHFALGSTSATRIDIGL